MKIRYILVWILPAALMAVIFYLSSQEAGESSRTSSPYAEFLADILFPDWRSFSSLKAQDTLDLCQFIVRKAAHFSVYALMGLLLSNAFRVSHFKLWYIFSPIVSFLFSLTDEFHQYFVPGRSCELRDVLIDTVGCIAGTAFFTLIIFIIRKRRKDDAEKISV